MNNFHRKEGKKIICKGNKNHMNRDDFFTDQIETIYQTFIRCDEKKKKTFRKHKIV